MSAWKGVDCVNLAKLQLIFPRILVWESAIFDPYKEEVMRCLKGGKEAAAITSWRWLWLDVVRAEIWWFSGCSLCSSMRVGQIVTDGVYLAFALPHSTPSSSSCLAAATQACLPETSALATPCCSAWADGHTTWCPSNSGQCWLTHQCSAFGDLWVMSSFRSLFPQLFPQLCEVLFL